MSSVLSGEDMIKQTVHDVGISAMVVSIVTFLICGFMAEPENLPPKEEAIIEFVGIDNSDKLDAWYDEARKEMVFDVNIRIKISRVKEVTEKSRSVEESAP